MGLIKKLLFLALVALLLYFGYTKFFKPTLEVGKERVRDFYGNVSVPNP